MQRRTRRRSAGPGHGRIALPLALIRAKLLPTSASFVAPLLLLSCTPEPASNSLAREDCIELANFLSPVYHPGEVGGNATVALVR